MEELQKLFPQAEIVASGIEAWEIYLLNFEGPALLALLALESHGFEVLCISTHYELAGCGMEEIEVETEVVVSVQKV